MTALEFALDAHIPAVAEMYANMVRRTYDSVIRDHGPSLKGLKNHFYNYRTWHELVSPYADRKQLPRFAECPDGPKMDGPVSGLNEERLKASALKYAAEAVRVWEAKITEKMDELQEARALHLTGASFAIHGRRHGLPVRIEQQMIVNLSSKGLPFNQFPARIYVEGKFKSAAAYKKMFA